MNTNSLRAVRPPVISNRDAAEIRALIDSASSRDREAADLLESELQRASVVATEALPYDAVRLDSRVQYRDDAGAVREVVVVRPRDAVPSAGRVSVLAPIGSALIGLRTGDLIEWALPSGRVRRYLVVSVEPPSPGGA